MTTARTYLLDLIQTDHGFDHAPAELDPLRIEAADAMLRAQRERIPVLDRRARETAIDAIRGLDDIVPLLFAHSVYKSYPQVLIEKRRWDKLGLWLSTLSADDHAAMDVEGVGDVDDWIARLAAHGTIMLATSGTSGKCSFLPMRAADRALKLRQFRKTATWPHPAPDNDVLVFWTAPIAGPSSVIEGGQFMKEAFAKPGGFFHFLKDPLRIAEVSEMAAFSRRMADGTATPTEIEAMAAKGRDKAERAGRDFAEFIQLVLDHRHDRMMLAGLWSQFMQIIDYARAQGIPEGDFNPASRITAGGGVKAVPLPEDYKERFVSFFGPVETGGVYSMTEITQLMPRCEAGRYHIPPALIAIVLDDAGETVLNRPGAVVSGRFAFLDLLVEGRWGGIISGDRVEMDFCERCACGRPGPVILDSIARFVAPGQDDHIGCAGTIESYVKGAISA